MVVLALLAAGTAGAQDSGEIGAGDSHTCAVLPGGTMKCWGHQEQNQLAHGQYGYSTGWPVDVVGIDDAVRMSGGYQFTCALLEQGSIKCFGYNRWGQLGTGASSCTYPEGASDCTRVAGIDDALDVAAGGAHACAVRAGGSVECWGLNNHGQLGQGNLDLGETPVPLPVPGIDTAFAVASGSRFSCALVDDGAVKCWGRNNQGQLGLGAASADPGVPTPSAVSGVADATAIVAGDSHACVLHSSGDVSCWGQEDYGALGTPEDALNSFRATPAALGFSDGIGLAAGDLHTCVLHADGAVRCFGENYYGQIGDGTNRNRSFTPVTVQNVASASALAAGGQHTCARVSQDPVNVKCWGSGNFGQIGNGAVGGVNERPGADHVVGAPFERIFGQRQGSFEQP